MRAIAPDPRPRLLFPQPDGNSLKGAYRAASVVLGEMIWPLTDGQLACEQPLLKDLAAQATFEAKPWHEPTRGNYQPRT